MANEPGNKDGGAPELAFKLGPIITGPFQVSGVDLSKVPDSAREEEIRRFHEQRSLPGSAALLRDISCGSGFELVALPTVNLPAPDDVGYMLVLRGDPAIQFEFDAAPEGFILDSKCNEIIKKLGAYGIPVFSAGLGEKKAIVASRQAVWDALARFEKPEVGPNILYNDPERPFVVEIGTQERKMVVREERAAREEFMNALMLEAQRFARALKNVPGEKAVVLNYHDILEVLAPPRSDSAPPPPPVVS